MQIELKRGERQGNTKRRVKSKDGNKSWTRNAECKQKQISPVHVEHLSSPGGG